MYQNRKNTNSQKVIASVVIILAVAILAVATTMLAKEGGENAGNTASTTPSTASSGTTGDSSASSPSSGTETGTGDSGAPDQNSSGATQAATYKDGTYTARSTYSTPGGPESITVTITVQSDIVGSASISQEASNQESQQYQEMFESGYKSFVVGKSLSSINVSRISGASLTTRGFNSALSQIKLQAQS